MSGEEAGETWYLRTRGRILGPLSWDQLRASRDRGQVARFDQVSRDRENWVSADSLERLFPRSASGGAFVGGPASSSVRPVPARDRMPDSEGFLILDDEDEGRPKPLAAWGAGRSPAADEPAGWYYAEAGSPQGPVGLAELKRLAKDGRVGPGTLYWRNGLEQWTAGADLPELNRLWPFDGGAGGESNPTSHPPHAPMAEVVPVSPVAPVSPLAMIGLVSNLLCGVGNLAAIVVGVLALRQIARSRGSLAGRRHAIAGIALGIAGLLILALAYLRLVTKAGD